MISLLRLAKYSSSASSYLNAVSPLDGRYNDKVSPLAPYFSEAALMRYRIVVESQWLLHMLENNIIPEDPTMPIQTVKLQLDNIVGRFNDEGAQQVKNIEKTTNHDLKSVEYYIKNNLNCYKEHVHFCCTSEDINNLAYALMLKEALQGVVLPATQQLLATLVRLS